MGLRELRLQGSKVSCGQRFIPCRDSHTIHSEDASEFGLSTWTLCNKMVTSFVVNDFVCFLGVLRPTRDFKLFYT